MTVKEVAGYLRISEQTVRDWVASGNLPGKQEDSQWYFNKSEIENWKKKAITTSKSPGSPALEISIQNLIQPSSIFLVDFTLKVDLLNFFIDKASTLPGVGSRENIAETTFKREELMSTGIGMGIAVPHVRLKEVKDLDIFMAVNARGIEEYNSLDDKPVRVAVFFVVGYNQHSEYIKALSIILAHLKNPLSFQQILAAPSPLDVFKILIGEY